MPLSHGGSYGDCGKAYTSSNQKRALSCSCGLEIPISRCRLTQPAPGCSDTHLAHVWGTWTIQKSGWGIQKGVWIHRTVTTSKPHSLASFLSTI